MQAAFTSEQSASGADFRVANAEASGLGRQTVDLITVAQALHWFDLDRFYLEAKRVLKPDGVIAVWSYGRASVSVECDVVIGKVFAAIDDYWLPEREIVESGYRDIPFPFAELTPPAFEMQADWSAAHMLRYMQTWSSSQRCFAQTGVDAVSQFADELGRAWGADTRTVRWPVNMRVGRNIVVTANT